MGPPRRASCGRRAAPYRDRKCFATFVEPFRAAIATFVEPFQAAIATFVEPFQAAIATFVERLHSRADHTPEFTSQEYVSNLYDMLEGSAGLLIALMTDPRHEQPLLPFLEELERVGAYELGANGFTGVDLQVLVRCHFGMVAFNAAFGDQLYRHDTGRPSRERIKTEMISFLVGGTAYRSVPDRPDSTRAVSYITRALELRDPSRTRLRGPAPSPRWPTPVEP